MLFCEKAEPVDWWSSFRRLMFGPRHFVEACVKCQHLWDFSLGQNTFPERNCISDCVASCQPFQGQEGKEDLRSLITQYAGFTPYLCSIFLVYTRSVYLWLNNCWVWNSRSPPGSGETASLLLGLEKGLANLTAPYTDFQLILLFSPLSSVFGSTCFCLQFLSFPLDKKDYFLSALSLAGGGKSPFTTLLMSVPHLPSSNILFSSPILFVVTGLLLYFFVSKITWGNRGKHVCSACYV